MWMRVTRGGSFIRSAELISTEHRAPDFLPGTRRAHPIADGIRRNVGRGIECVPGHPASGTLQAASSGSDAGEGGWAAFRVDSKPPTLSQATTNSGMTTWCLHCLTNHLSGR